jgi:hypothetical protein
MLAPAPVGVYAAQPRQAYIAPSTVAPVFSPELQSLHTHSSIGIARIAGNGFYVAVITAIASFLVMYLSRSRIFCDSKRAQESRFKWPLVYAVVILAVMLAVQRIARLGEYTTLLNPHTATSFAFLLVLGFIAAVGNKKGDSNATAEIDPSVVAEGVRRAATFANAATNNPDRFEATQQAALAEGHLYAFSTLFNNDHARLTTASGQNTDELSKRIRSIRAGFYGTAAPVPPPPPRAFAQSLRR